MGHNSVVSGYPKSIRIPRVKGLSTNPWVLGRHNVITHGHEREEEGSLWNRNKQTKRKKIKE